MVRGVEQLSLVISHRSQRNRPSARHRTGTPGKVPYRSRTIDATRVRRPKARHLKQKTRPRLAGAQVALALAVGTALVLLVLSGYQAAEGAAIVLGLF